MDQSCVAVFVGAPFEILYRVRDDGAYRMTREWIFMTFCTALEINVSRRKMLGVNAHGAAFVCRPVMHHVAGTTNDKLRTTQCTASRA